VNSTSGVFKAHPGVISANSGVVEANPEAIEALESWMLTPELVSLTPGAVEAEFRESKKKLIPNNIPISAELEKPTSVDTLDGT
jgi:hypothetical protein